MPLVAGGGGPDPVVDLLQRGQVGVRLVEPEQLRVRPRQVVGLEEAVERGLPVAGQQHAGHPPVAHVLQLERREDPRDRVEVLEQRHRVLVHGDEHEPGPFLGPQLDEGQVVVRARHELLAVEHQLDRAVQVPPPSVERADERADPAPAARQPGAPVPAGVVIRLDRVLGRPHHQDRVGRDLVLDEAADLLQFLGPAGHQPGPCEQLFQLELEEFGVEVPGLGHESAPEPVLLRDHLGGDVTVEPGCSAAQWRLAAQPGFKYLGHRNYTPSLQFSGRFTRPRRRRHRSARATAPLAARAP